MTKTNNNKRNYKTKQYELNKIRKNNYIYIYIILKYPPFINKRFVSLAGACRSAWPGCCYCWLMGIQLWKWHATYCVLADRKTYLFTPQSVFSYSIYVAEMCLQKKNWSLAYWFDSLDQILVLSFEFLYQEKNLNQDILYFCIKYCALFIRATVVFVIFDQNVITCSAFETTFLFKWLGITFTFQSHFLTTF